MIAAKSFEFLSLAEDSAVTDLDYSDGSDSPPDYEEVADHLGGPTNHHHHQMVFNLHNDTLYSKTSSSGDNNTSSLELSADPVHKAKILQSTVFCIHRDEGCRWTGHGMLGLRNYVKDDTLYIKIRADPNKGVAV